MSEEEELQREEIEVLESIYEGDECYKAINPTTYQYKYIESEKKSFILEVSWGPKYPNEMPTINLDIFYNQNIAPKVKEKIRGVVEKEAEQWLGSAMTYTLFECLKDRLAELLEEQEEEQVPVPQEKVQIDEQAGVEVEKGSKPSERKEQLTKAQKRRAWDKAEAGRGGEKPRGWDWVDIVKHLSQTPHPSQAAAQTT